MASKPKHTPAPWTSTKAKHPVDGEYDYAIEAGGKVIAEAFGRVAEGTAGLRPAEENAQLIAAAPDLLAALKDQLDSHWATWMAARAEVEGVALSKQLFEEEPDVIRARELVAKFEA